MTLEYFYAAHSAFAYIGSARLFAIATRADCTVIHRPFDLDRVLTGSRGASFGARTEAHLQYYFGREIERWCEHRGVPMMAGFPTHHGHDYSLAGRLIIAAAGHGNGVDKLSHALLEAHWCDDGDLADEATLARLAGSVGYDPVSLLASARDPSMAAQYEANTVEAIERSVFGSPTYFVDGDMFYGQDRLELVERALTKPFAGRWPRAAPQDV